VIRLIIADDDGAVRARLRGLLESEPGIEIVAVVADGDTALVRTRSLAPDVLVLDDQMPGAWGSEVAQTLARERSTTRIIIYSAEDTVHGWARGLGAVRFVAKDEPFEVLLDAIRGR
jgi:DNA-binding NarL/FixJ family response regulator